MQTKESAFEIFNLLSEREQALVHELMLRLVPDDVATREDLLAHSVAMEEHQRGETVSDEEIDWE